MVKTDAQKVAEKKWRLKPGNREKIRVWCREYNKKRQSEWEALPVEDKLERVEQARIAIMNALKDESHLTIPKLQRPRITTMADIAQFEKFRGVLKRVIVIQSKQGNTRLKFLYGADVVCYIPHRSKAWETLKKKKMVREYTRKDL